MNKVIHSDNCSRVFKNYDMTCPRCQELANGSKARAGWNDTKLHQEAARSRAIQSHNCQASKCMSVCVAFDW